MLERIDLYGLMIDILVLEPNIYRRPYKHYSRNVNGIFTHRAPTLIFQVYSHSEHYSIATRERESLNDDWNSVARIIIPKNA